MNRCIALIVAIMGVASLVSGIIFFVQANSGRQALADELAPLTISQVNATYETVKTSQTSSTKHYICLSLRAENLTGIS